MAEKKKAEIKPTKKKGSAKAVEQNLDPEKDRVIRLKANIIDSNPTMGDGCTAKIFKTEDANIHILELKIVMQLTGVKRPPDPSEG
jgi:hypothetical protein